MFNLFRFLRKTKDPIYWGKGAEPTKPNPQKDYLHIEVAASMQPALWQEKKPEDFISYPIKDQGTTSSCVAQKYAKQLEIDEYSENDVYRILSPHSIYPFGYVPPNGGMDNHAASKIVVNQGATLEVLFNSNGLSEEQMRDASGYKNDAKQVALIYKPDSIVFVQPNIETIASILFTYQRNGIKKGVGMVVVGFDNGTWLSPFPLPKPVGRPWFHAVTGTDFGLINGKKYISFDNSWGTYIGMGGKQFLSEDYFNAGFVIDADYTINLPDNWRDNIKSLPKPSYKWEKDLGIGSSGYDVLMLQKALQYLGMFPPDDNVLSASGVFYGLTRAGVMQFQIKYGIEPATGYFGPKTRALFNEMFK